MFDDTVVSKAEDMPQFLFDCANNTKGTGVDLVDKNNSPKPKKKQAGPSLSMKMSNSARKKVVATFYFYQKKNTISHLYFLGSRRSISFLMLDEMPLRSV